MKANEIKTNDRTITEKELNQLQQDKMFFKLPLDYFPDERWEVYKEHPDYLVSSYGRVYSIKTKRLLMAERTNRGYWKFEFWENGQRVRRISAQRLVAIVFLGMPDTKEFEAHHPDKNKRYDNRADNLKAVTVKLHRKIHRLYDEYERNNKKKLTAAAMKRITADVISGKV